MNDSPLKSIELPPLDDAALKRIIDKIVSQVGRRIDESTPMVDARLSDGSRVNAIIPPLAVDGPLLSIRRFSTDKLMPADLVELKALTPGMMELLEACVKAKMNIIIAGGTGAGKTTLLNALSSFISPKERIVTIEDAAELQLKQTHVVRLETRPASMEGTNSVTIRDLIKNALRMRPDRIIVGECRDGAALDMLQAMNTGHDGSMTTTHANSPRECIARLETLCLMSGMDLPIRAIREQISSAFDLLVQISRLVDGSRRITHVTEVLRMESDVITLQDVFVAKPPDEDSHTFGNRNRLLSPLRCTGLKPQFLDKLAANGVGLHSSFFTPEDETGPGMRETQQAPKFGGFE